MDVRIGINTAAFNRILDPAMEIAWKANASQQPINDLALNGFQRLIGIIGITGSAVFLGLRHMTVQVGAALGQTFEEFGGFPKGQRQRLQAVDRFEGIKRSVHFLSPK
ncbi:hypothetical protein D3C80_1935830 [compost metagenome]